jgi:DNA-binding CsgD family transcriptional regulator
VPTITNGMAQCLRPDIAESQAATTSGWESAGSTAATTALPHASVEALSALTPMLAHLDAVPPATEIVAASLVPDIVEAMVVLGQLADAEPLIDILETNGRRLDRAWMLAVGGRCRGMLLAAKGDLESAIAAVEQAMVAHERLPMPFERARTQLLLGQIQRRLRRKDAPAAALRAALATFEKFQFPLWADRVRAELARTKVGSSARTSQLTPSEQRVAELAAAGMSSREIAAALFITAKTVDVNLYRVYRKLDIQSRSQLAGRLDGRSKP